METNYLSHHGIKGQRWGVRRYQNADGSLTSEGKARLGNYKEKENQKISKKYDKKISKLDQKIKVKRTEGKSIDRAIKKRGWYATRRAIEKSAVKNMSYKDMVKEKRAVGRNAVSSVLFTIGGFTVLPAATGAVLPFSVYGVKYPTPSATKEWNRS